MVEADLHICDKCKYGLCNQLNCPLEKKLEFIWPITSDWNHFQIESELTKNPVLHDWEIFKSALNGIYWKDILSLHARKYSQNLSISKALSESLDKALIKVGSLRKVRIFSDGSNSSKPFVIEHKLNTLAIDFSFGHYQNIVWKLARLAVSVGANINEKESHCKVGILILPESELRKVGNFDSDSTWERALDYIKYMGHQWPVPILLMGLKNPDIFVLQDNEKGSKPRCSIIYK